MIDTILDPAARSLAMNLIDEDLARAHTNERLVLTRQRCLAKQSRRRQRAGRG